MIKMLIVEDNIGYGEILVSFFREHDFEVDFVPNPFDAIELVTNKEYDIIIVDLKMKELTGLQLIHVLQKIGNKAVKIILTNSNDAQDELEALDLGVSTFLKKNTDSNIILKRIQIALEEQKKMSPANEKNLKLISKSENIQIDLETMIVTHNGDDIKLTRKEMALLVLFLSNKNIPLTRKEIIEKGFQTTTDLMDERTVDVHIKRLRQKLGLLSLVSVHGVGYKWYEL